MRYISSNTSQLAIEVSFAVSLMNLTLTIQRGLRPLQSLWTGCSTSHSRGILTEFLHEQGLSWGCDRKTSSSRLSDSGEEAKVKGTRKVGGVGKREKEAPALPSFLPFYFRVRAFSIQRPDYLRAWNRLNCLQMSFQKQLIFISYLKTLGAVSGAPARI